MKVIKPFLAILIVLILLVGCSTPVDITQNTSTGTTGATTTQKQNTNPSHLVLAIKVDPTDNIDTSALLWQFVQEKTNTELEFISFPTDGFDEKRNTFLASGQYYDMVATESSIANFYGAQGVFADIDAVISQYKATNLASISDKMSTVSLRDLQGNLYMIPTFYPILQVADTTLMYDTKLLESMGEAEPESMEEWLNLFRKVKSLYPDKIPFTLRGANQVKSMMVLWDIVPVSGYFGIIDSKESEKKIVFLPQTDEFKVFIKYFQTLYKEQLLDKEYVTLNMDQLTERVANARIFASYWNGYRVDWSTEQAINAGKTNVKYWQAKVPLNSVGKRIYYGANTPWLDSGLSINAKSNNIEASIRLFDYLSTEEGKLTYNYGFSGEQYDMVNGKAVMKVELLDKIKQLGFASYIPYGKYYADPFELYASWYNWDYSSCWITMGKVNTPYMKTMPLIKLNADDQKTYSNLSTAINGIIDPFLDAYILGQIDDAALQDIINQCKNVGLDQGMQLAQKGFDQYTAILNK